MTKTIVAVGSKNPAKIEAVRLGFMKGWLKLDPSIHCSSETLLSQSSSLLNLIGYDVDSEVSLQPIGDDETKKGAVNRATAAYQAHNAQYGHPPHFSVGLEGGISTKEQGNVPYPLIVYGLFIMLLSFWSISSGTFILFFLISYHTKVSMILISNQ